MNITFIIITLNAVLEVSIQRKEHRRSLYPLVIVPSLGLGTLPSESSFSSYWLRTIVFLSQIFLLYHLISKDLLDATDIKRTSGKIVLSWLHSMRLDQLVSEYVEADRFRRPTSFVKCHKLNNL